MNEVQAYIFGKKIGTILLKDGRVYFQYDKEFKNANLEISPLKLPLSMSGIYTNNNDEYFEGLAGVFHDTLPDKFGTKIMQRFFESKNISPYELNIIQKLMFIGDKSLGAISYKPVLHVSRNHDEILQLQDFYENAKKIIKGNKIEVVEEMLNFMDSAASVGGARAKATIGYNEFTNEMISGVSKNLKDNFEYYIIKFDIEKDDKSSSDFTKIEFLYMNMAKEIGIEVPKISLLNHNNLSHFLIKRFDKTKDKTFHLHSVAGLTHANFNLPKHFSYDELFRLTRFLTNSQKAVNEQYKRMVFNIIGRNQDDHAKNFSFLMDADGIWNISPAYDITYANGLGYTKNHQLSLLGKTDNFTKDDLLKIARNHSIKENYAKECIEQTKDIFSTFKSRAKQLDINDDFIAKICREFRFIPF